MVKANSAASAVWIAQGLVMNGGVLHCVESLSKRELRAAIAGYRSSDCRLLLRLWSRPQKSLQRTPVAWNRCLMPATTKRFPMMPSWMPR